MNKKKRNKNKTNKIKNLEDDIDNNNQLINTDTTNNKTTYIFLISLKKIIIFCFKASGIYIMWICLHYFASQLYIKFCTPTTIIGFLLSPFLTSTPHCQALRWIIYNGGIIINNMWVILATWVCANIFVLNTNTPSST